MIQTCTAFNPLPEPAITPFCDKNFQSLRLTAATIGRICLSIIYTIASYCCGIFSEDYSHYFQSLANYYNQLNFAQSEAFDQFGNTIIDFSVNTTKRPPDSGYENVSETLKELYGDELIAQWSTIGTAEIPLDLTKLKCLKMAEPEDGCCIGMSIDFIFRYLKEIKKGIPPLESVKRVAPLYAEGATNEAEISQIFHWALNPANALERQGAMAEPQFKAHIAAWTQRINQEAITEVAQEAEKESAEIYVRGIDATEIENQVAILHSGLVQRVEQKAKQLASQKRGSVLLQITNASNTECAQIDFARKEIVAQQMGLSAQFFLFHFLRSSQKAWGDFHNFITNLPTGAYLIGVSQLLTDQSNRHALAFIKTDNQSFILDPNYATVVLPQEEAAQGLWEITTAHYLQKGFCSIAFNRLELLQASIPQNQPAF